MQNKTIWALTDGRPGNDNQTLAVAGKLGLYEVKRINFSSLAQLPNFVLGTSTLGIETTLEEHYPDFVIAAGRKLSRVARIIKKRSNGKTKIIQLMWPGYACKSFDLIFSPQHDNLSPCPNLVETYGSPNNINSKILNFEADKWRNRVANDAPEMVAVLLGDISEEQATHLAGPLNELPYYPLITTSRRTSAEAIEVLKQRITCERYLYEWKPDTENPYTGFLGLADYIIVSEDSISMMAESCTTGKPVYILKGNVPKKHKLFSQSLIESGRAQILKTAVLTKYNYEPLNTLDFVAKSIKERLFS